MSIALYESDVAGKYANFFDTSSVTFTGEGNPITIHVTRGDDFVFTKGVSKDYDRVANAVKQAIELYR